MPSLLLRSTLSMTVGSEFVVINNYGVIVLPDRHREIASLTDLALTSVWETFLGRKLCGKAFPICLHCSTSIVLLYSVSKR